MKKLIFKTVLPLLAVALVGVVFATSCEKEKERTPELSGELAFLKSIIGQKQGAIPSVANEKGFSSTISNEYFMRLFVKEEDGFTKKLIVYANDTNNNNEYVVNAELYATGGDFEARKQLLKKWLGQLRQLINSSKIVDEYYTFSHDYNGSKVYSSLDELYNDIDIAQFDEHMYFAADCRDIKGYQYSVCMWEDRRVGGGKDVSMQIINSKIHDNSTDTIPYTNTVVGKNDDMLVMLVDYMTFRYIGYTTVNVADKTTFGSVIPFQSEYMSPGDFGYVKFYYNEKKESDLLFYGTIIWSGCGRMEYPTNLKRGNTVSSAPLYPGDSQINWVGIAEKTQKDFSYGQELWNTISKREEFQWFYSRTRKKVSVFCYQPSVGIGDPNDAFFVVFVENQ